MKTYTRLACLLIAALPVALFASSDNDRKIEEAAKASYNYKTVLSDHVKVSSDDGVVTLTGTVQDSDEKNLAEDTVENIPSVVRVVNNIEVKSDVPEHSDAWIAMKIKGRLLVRGNVSATATQVDVKDGFVTLSGTAANQAQKELTALYVKDIDNVKGVKNNIVVVAPAAGATTVSEDMDDASITTQVKYALLSHRATSAIKTKVITNSGAVTITGEASSDAEKALVTQLAKRIRGVKSVSNDMTVVS